MLGLLLESLLGYYNLVGIVCYVDKLTASELLKPMVLWLHRTLGYIQQSVWSSIFYCLSPPNLDANPMGVNGGVGVQAQSLLSDPMLHSAMNSQK